MGFKVQNNKKKKPAKTTGKTIYQASAPDSGFSQEIPAIEEPVMAAAAEPVSDPVRDKAARGKASKTEAKAASKEKAPRRRYSVLTICFIVIALGVFGFSLFQISAIFADYHKSGAEYKDITADLVKVDVKTGFKEINYSRLEDTNSDFVAWIDIPGTDISYPIVQSLNNNDDYLRTTFQKQYATAGSIFIDYRCPNAFTDRLTIIYGHRMNDNTMFAQLKKFLQQSFWEDHREIHIYTEDGIQIYNVFSSYTATVEDECYAFNFESDQAFLDWGKSVAGKSNYVTGISLNRDSRVILLSTCVYQQENNRNVVLAVYDHTEKNP